MNLKLLTVYAVLLSFSISVHYKLKALKLLLQNMDLLIAAPKDKEASVLMLITDKSGNEKKREASLKAKREIQKII